MDHRITPRQGAEERALRFGLIVDTCIISVSLPVAILGGSLTLMADSIRFLLMLMIEYFAYAVMWHVHRGKLQDMEFGGGKLEQIANFVTGLGMLGAAAWIGFRAVSLVSGQAPIGTPLGLALAAILGAVNTYFNLLIWNRMREAAKGDCTVVMLGQYQARTVKLVASAIVQIVMTIAALSTDRTVIAWTDAVGSIFVASFIVWNAFVMLRMSIPDLIDRTAGRAVHATIDRVLTGFAGDYERLDRVRSRRSGRVVFIELVLSFDRGLTIEEVNRRVGALKDALHERIEHADVSILTTGDYGMDLLRARTGGASKA